MKRVFFRKKEAVAKTDAKLQSIKMISKCDSFIGRKKSASARRKGAA